MKLGIMQPYFFPYIGYWQLMNAVDTYVIYDDVNYIQQGWINRNKVLVNGKGVFFTLLLDHASSFKKINEITLFDFIRTKKKLLNTIRLAYAKAPFFSEIYPVVEEVFDTEDTNLSHFLIRQIAIISKYLNINTNFVISSNLDKNNKLTGEDKIIDICKKLKASYYINAIGGRDLYSRKNFEAEGIQLCFLKSDTIFYEQNKKLPFIENLSIIDVLMFSSKEQIQEFLLQYQIE